MRRSGGTKKLKTDEGVGLTSSSSTNPGDSSKFKQDETADEEIETDQEGSSSTTPTTSSGAAKAVRIVRNPLTEEPDILRHLLKLCPKDMLRNFRLVCKQWYEESLHAWRAFPVVVCFRYDLKVFSTKMVSGKLQRQLTPLQEFLTFFENPINRCSTQPYRFIEIRNVYGIALIPGHYVQLLTALGNNLTRLDLINCSFYTAEGFRKVIFATLTACPYLQTFNLEYCDYVNGGQEGAACKLEYREPLYGKHRHLKSLRVCCRKSRLPISWLELFSHLPSLTHFTINLSEEEKYPQEFQQWTDSIKVVRNQDWKALQFQLVEISPAPEVSSDPTSQKKIQIIQQLRLPLKSLCFKIQPGTEEQRVENILKFHAQTLREIKIAGTGSTLLSQPFPFGVQLDNLTTLEIAEELCGTMAFLKFTPRLERLVITRVGRERIGTAIISNSCNQEMTHVRMVNLKLLKMDYTALTDEDLERLSQWTPNLRYLYASINFTQENIVDKCWKNLRSISYYSNCNSDSDCSII